MLSGCGAVDKYSNYRSPEIHSIMTKSIFLPPVNSPEKKTIYIASKNSSNVRYFDIQYSLVNALASRGYAVVDNPKNAHYVLHTNILSIDQDKRREHNRDSSVLSAGTGARVGAAAGYGVTTDNSRTTGVIAGSLLGAGAGYLLDSNMNVTSQTITTDIQITENKGYRYNTRITTSVTKAKLNLEEFAPQLMQSIAESVAGIF
jgi:hypothetical protein